MAIKLNPEVKEKWCAALESGKYAQAKGALRTAEGGYCCLGVLCDVRDSTKWTSASCYALNAGLPPDDVRVWAGFEVRSSYIKRAIPAVSIDGVITGLDSHNDNGKTFAQIAAAIREQL
jgi:hypothetical protein